MKRWLLLYDVAPDYVTRRAPLREEHLRLAREARDRGELVLAGAYGASFDPTPDVEGAALLFQGPDRSAAERFAASDPYVKNGIITRWRVFEWNVVVE